jgi:hypothetical protein
MVMSLQEFNQLLDYVKQNNVVGAPNRVSGTPSIKRVTPHIDVMDSKVYRIDFTRMDSTINTFEERELDPDDGTLLEACMTFLKSKGKTLKAKESRTAIHNRRRANTEPLVAPGSSPWAVPSIFNNKQ